MRKFSILLALLLLLGLLLCGCRKSEAEPYTVEDEWGTLWEIDPKNGTITGDGVTYEFKIRGDQQDYTIFIDYPNNNRYTEDKVGDEIFGNYKMISSNVFWTYMGNFFGVDVYHKYVDASLADGEVLTALLYPLIPEEEPPKDLTLPLVLIALGAVDIVWPKFFWIFRYGLAFREAMPSKTAPNIQFAIGLVALILGIVLMIV